MQAVYDTIGVTYSSTRCADPVIVRDLARYAGARNGFCFLDVACGTGHYTKAIAAFGGHWFGTDISEVMLKQAEEKSSEIKWSVSSADFLPYPDSFFDGVICSLAIHHFRELAPAFRSIWQVLKRGRFVIFTAFAEQMQGYWLCHYFPEMMQRSAEKMPTKQLVVSELQAIGFKIETIVPFDVTNELKDLFLYSGKDRPEIYFDPEVRANISSFALLCPPEELRAGLIALRADLDSGRFQEIAKSYATTAGDYAYVVANKCIADSL
jgi:ubiquinone/menaquinone biosynthesis C-methylase UbiE